MLGMQAIRRAVTPFFRSRALVQDRPGNNSAPRSLDNLSPRSAHIRTDRPLARPCLSYAARRITAPIEKQKLMFAKPINSNRHPRKSLRDALIVACSIPVVTLIAAARL